MIEENDIALILLAQNTNIQFLCRFHRGSPTGYVIGPRVEVFRGKEIPERVSTLLKKNGLPIQHKYGKREHLNRLFRLIKPVVQLSKNPQQYNTAVHHLDTLPDLLTHDDVIKALEILDNEPI